MTDFIKITSRKNDAVLRCASLLKNKGREEENAFITEGIKLFLEADSAGFVPREVFVSEDFLKSESAEKFISKNTCPKVYEVTREVYEKISDENSPEGLLCVFDKFSLVPEKDSVTILLEDMRDPGNLGTVLRSAAALGAREVVATGSCDVFSPKVVRATMGAIFRIPFTAFDTVDDAISYARTTSGKVYAAALSEVARDIAEVDTSRACVMIGNEGHGLSQNAISQSDGEVIIPIEAVESLNASVAASIVLYDSMRKRNAR